MGKQKKEIINFLEIIILNIIENISKNEEIFYILSGIKE
jgi:hypothetical protein